MRLKILTLTFLTSLFAHYVNGQDIKDGFIVLPDGKYQYGFIQLSATLNTYEECLFKPDNKNEFKKYTPDQINGYGVINGIYFVTREITIEGTEQKRFIKNEMDQLVKFYSYTDNRFFLEKEDFKELHSDDYKTLLAGALTSCKSIQSFIRKTGFNLTSLQALFLKYQRCTNPESVPLSVKRVEFELMAGVEFNNSTLKAASNYSKNYSKNDISLTDKTLFSIGINTIIPFKKSKHFSFATGISYYQQNFYDIHHSIATDYSSTDKINLDYYEVLIPIELHYSLFKSDKKVMPYLKAGVSIPITIKSSFTWENEKEYTHDVFYERYTNLPQQFKQDLQLIVAAGSTFTLMGKIRNVLEVSYINGGGKLKDSLNSFSVDSNRIVILLGFRF